MLTTYGSETLSGRLQLAACRYLLSIGSTMISRVVTDNSNLNILNWRYNGVCCFKISNTRIIPRMLLDLHNLVGYAAALLTTVAFVPQALKSWQTRDLSGVSLPMYCLFTVGVAMWLVYGVMLDSWPIIIGNAITIVFASVVLALKVAHR
jgi:MtN3 and saliva related transmembrane protein